MSPSNYILIALGLCDFFVAKSLWHLRKRLFEGNCSAIIANLYNGLDSRTPHQRHLTVIFRIHMLQFTVRHFMPLRGDSARSHDLQVDASNLQSIYSRSALSQPRGYIFSISAFECVAR